MHAPKRARVALAVVAVLCGLGVAGAQPGGGTGAVSAASRADVTLTPAEMGEKGAAFIPEMEKATEDVRQQHQKAVAAKDVLKATCLKDKLDQLELVTTSAKERLNDLRKLLESDPPDADMVKQDFTVLTVFRERADELVAEAQQCVGAEQGYLGESDVTMDVDPDIPDDVLSDFPVDPVDVTPPVLTSPTF